MAGSTGDYRAGFTIHLLPAPDLRTRFLDENGARIRGIVAYSIRHLRARTASPEEKRHWWPRLTAVWPAYSEYQSKTERDIPVVLLEAPE